MPRDVIQGSFAPVTIPSVPRPALASSSGDTDRATPPGQRPAPHARSARPTALATAIQRHGAGQPFQLPREFACPDGGGHPLPEIVRRNMESAFNANFADVRVHVGPQARSLGALATLAGACIHALTISPNAANPNYVAAIAGVHDATGDGRTVWTIDNEVSQWAKENGFQ